IRSSSKARASASPRRWAGNRRRSARRCAYRSIPRGPVCRSTTAECFTRREAPAPGSGRRRIERRGRAGVGGAFVPAVEQGDGEEAADDEGDEGGGDEPQVLVDEALDRGAEETEQHA